MKSKKAKAGLFLSGVAAILAVTPMLLTHAQSLECAAIGCSNAVSIGGGIIVGLLTLSLTPIASVAAGAVFSA